MFDEREVKENIVEIFFDFWFIIFKIEGIIFIFDLSFELKMSNFECVYFRNIYLFYIIINCFFFFINSGRY